MLKNFFSQKFTVIPRICAGIVIGILLGIFFPNVGFFEILGALFVGALKAIAPILVFMLIMTSIAKHKSGQTLYIKNIIVLYVLGTFAGAVVACVASSIFPVTITLQNVEGAAQEAPKEFSEVIETILTGIVQNPLQSLISGSYLSILFWAILIGFALKKVSKGVNLAIEELSDATNQLIKWIILTAPFGILGLVYDSVATTGVQGLAQFGYLILLLVGCMLFTAFVVNAIIVAIMIRSNPYPLIWYTIKNSALYAFFMRSSAANIPNNLKAASDLGLTKDSYSISLPLGATVNMSGAAITITVMTLATVHTLGIPVSFSVTVILSILAALSAAGASGVAGGSLLLIPLACNLFGISPDIAMQVVGVGFIIGVIQDSVETALNSSSDLLFTATSEFHDRIKKGEKVDFKAILSGNQASA